MYRVTKSGHFKLKMEFRRLKKCCEMNQSFLSAFYYIFFNKLSASANNVQFHGPYKSGKLVSVSTIILHLH